MKKSVKDIVNPPKPWWKSKTLWLGVIQIAIAIASYIEGQLLSGSVVLVSGILTVIFRYLTDAPITTPVMFKRKK